MSELANNCSVALYKTIWRDQKLFSVLLEVHSGISMVLKVKIKKVLLKTKENFSVPNRTITDDRE